MSFDLRGRRRRPIHAARGDAYARLELEQRLFTPKSMCFLQHDMDIANGSGATVRSDLNNAIEALTTLSSGATEPASTYQYQLWADTTAGLLKQRNAANTGWEVRATLAETLAVARSSNTIIAAGDFGKTFVCTSTFTQTLTAAVTLGDGFICRIRNDGTGIITIDPNGGETIDGATLIELLPGDSCTLFCDGSNWKTIGRVQRAVVELMRGYIFGLDTSNNAVDPTNDIDIAAGRCVDTTGVAYMRLAATLTKQIDAGWAVGTGAGGLDTGTVANDTWYYTWLIMRSDTGVVDALFSLSSTAPTMPTNYDRKQLIGPVRRGTAANVLYYQDGDWVKWRERSTVLTAGTSASEANVSLAAAVPSIAKSAIMFGEHFAGSGQTDRVSTVKVVTGKTLITLQNSTAFAWNSSYFEVPNVGQNVIYLTSGSLHLYVLGFKLARGTA